MKLIYVTISLLYLAAESIHYRYRAISYGATYLREAIDWESFPINS